MLSALKKRPTRPLRDRLDAGRASPLANGKPCNASFSLLVIPASGSWSAHERDGRVYGWTRICGADRGRGHVGESNVVTKTLPAHRYMPHRPLAPKISPRRALRLHPPFLHLTHCQLTLALLRPSFVQLLNPHIAEARLRAACLLAPDPKRQASVQSPDHRLELAVT